MPQLNIMEIENNINLPTLNRTPTQITQSQITNPDCIETKKKQWKNKPDYSNRSQLNLDFLLRPGLDENLVEDLLMVIVMAVMSVMMLMAVMVVMVLWL